MSMHLYDQPVFSKLIFFEKGISAMSNLQVNMTKDPIVKSLVIFALPILSVTSLVTVLLLLSAPLPQSTNCCLASALVLETD